MRGGQWVEYEGRGVVLCVVVHFASMGRYCKNMCIFTS